jgi:mannitol-1-phosphate 5-dehydrogenase
MTTAEQSKVLIFGAGRIGRGFIGDIFNYAGYHLVFVDQAQTLIDLLNSQGVYTIVRAANENDLRRIKISDYEAYHTSQEDKLEKAVRKTDLIVIAVFPKDFEGLASQLAELIIKRREEKPDTPLNIILATNLVHAGPIFKGYLYKNLDEEQSQYFDSHVGVVESLVIRIAPNAPEEELKKDPLTVWTNGFMEFPVESNAFRGALPLVPSFRLIEDMRAEEKRKMYTYNMCHAVLSYHGYQKRYTLLVDCLADYELSKEAEDALNEVSQALQIEYGFTEEEMNTWIAGVLQQTNNWTIGDSVVRMADDPIRKLSREDRLIGPALLCLKNNIEPIHLIGAIGAAFNYLNLQDPPSVTLQNRIKELGIVQAIRITCGLNQNAFENALLEKIEKSYHYNKTVLEWRRKASEAYDLGFKYEKIYHGCGQCVFAAITETLGIFSDDVFKASTGLCGGIGLMNDGTCSAYTGGVLAIGLLFNRGRENFGGDRENKYKNFKIVQNLRERFIHEFGTITCSGVHQKKYGRFFDLSKKEESIAFEEAGGHGDIGCTQTVGKAAQLTMEILTPYMINLMEENPQ